MGLPLKKLTVADYLEWENAQVERHEFCCGEVFAMVGMRRIHGLVSGNVFVSLSIQLKGRRCRPFTESLKVQPSDDAVFYPDVFVTCDPEDLKTDMVFQSPSLIVEVLSESTKGFDRGLKFASYRQIKALKEYLLIDPLRRSVELFRRGADGLFVLHDMTGLEEFELQSVACRLKTVDIFEGL